MDSLSHLIRIFAPTGSVDVRCNFGGVWAVPHEAVPLGRIPWHVVLDGRCRVLVAQRDVVLDKGDVLMLAHGSAHTMRSVLDGFPQDAVSRSRDDGPVVLATHPGEGEPLDMLCGEFCFDGAARALLDALPEIAVVSVATRPDCAWLTALIAMMRSECSTGHPGSAAVISELATVLFTILLRALIAEGRPGLLGVLSDRRLSPAIAAVLRDPAADWTIATMAGRCNLSRSAFARQFALVSRETPLEIVTSIRMEVAGRLLTREKLAVGLCAERCGYASEAAFTRVFKAHHGVAPGSYRHGEAR